MKTSHAAVLVIAALLAVGAIAFQIGSTMSRVVTVTQTTVSPGYYSSGTPQPYYGFSSDPPSIFITTLSPSSYPKVIVVGSASEIMRVFREIGYLDELSDLSPVASDPFGWLKSHPGVLFNDYAAFKGVAYFEGREVTTTVTVTKTVDTAEARVRDFILYVRSGPPYNYPHLERNLAWFDISPWGIRSLKIEELRLSQDNKIIEVYNVVYVDLDGNTYRYDALAIER